MAEQTVAEMIAVALGWKPQQAERLMRDMDSPDVRVSFDWEKGATMEAAVGCATQGDKFVAAVRAFDAATQPDPKEPEPVSEEGDGSKCPTCGSDDPAWAFDPIRPDQSRRPIIWHGSDGEANWWCPDPFHVALATVADRPQAYGDYSHVEGDVDFLRAVDDRLAEHYLPSPPTSTQPSSIPVSGGGDVS